VPPRPHPVDARLRWPLFDVAATRRIETLALAGVAPHTLMQRAGLSVARLALAIAPHARTIWVAAGPGNNGGDGLEAAAQLQRMGKTPVVTWLGDAATASSDTAASWQRARDAGVVFATTPPPAPDLCIDALLGIGATRAPAGRMVDWINHMTASGTPVLAIDLPTGLDADTGHGAQPHVQAHHTLSLLTLKPGLFTAMGRDAAGRVWFDDLQVRAEDAPYAALAGPCATVGGRPGRQARPHASHKGSYGDVAVVGGAPGMAGAALLAASAALHYGAGRVYLAALDPSLSAAALSGQPELMLRAPGDIDLGHCTVVCGCGGGDAVRAEIPRVLAGAARLVLDADALNALAGDTQLQQQLRHRALRGRPTILTPHPLEAARLLATDSRVVQQDRLSAARQLARDYDCTVLLKGSGTVIASPGQLPHLNPTGNARLATAGTGDVLAGALGAALAFGLAPHAAACEVAWQHGLCADTWPCGSPLVAGELARCLQPPGCG
jgi:hydroxyethylthiazole kinase-like uncharacterized protein yjeF